MQTRGRFIIVASCAAVGGLAAILLLRIPPTYLASATVRLQIGEEVTDDESFRIQLKKFMYQTFRDQDSLGAIVRKEKLYGYRGDQDVRSLNGLIERVRLAMRLELVEHAPGDRELHIGFIDEDPSRAQRILGDLLSQMIKASTTQPDVRFEVLSPSSLPEMNEGPRRHLYTALGSVIGAVLGFLLIWMLRLREEWNYLRSLHVQQGHSTAPPGHSHLPLN
jgi:hypothetical protein